MSARQNKIEQKVKVLIIEDNVDFAMQMAELFELWEYSVRTAFDGMGALKMAKTFVPDVVIMDIGLPNLNGFIVARILCTEPEYKCPFIIAVSGYGSDAYRKTAAESGIHQYFTKPPNMDTIRKLIEDHLPIHQQSKN